ncbi:DUF3299 domain-containing protein [Roseateles violae]|uniref:DUF3299 domain-containing protein n=1 Tax=Roseateles violae TaxID=3058042 RepID=A0ABT8DQN5_9BURK|nr:DUF3299 domain-containing protein [Pelomonas sp. PFR6]MDN3919393.1 DUF3299 domain-containing protein [Pelomonas sp. PFR6]
MSTHERQLNQVRRALVMSWIAAAVIPAQARANAYRDIGWSALSPPGWNHMEGLSDLVAEAEDLPDDDPRAKALMDKLRAAGNQSPTVDAMNGVDVMLPGYAVAPDDAVMPGLSQFLLVPYLGSCIHSPPPPSNQTLNCRATEPIIGLRSMDAIWVFGRLRIERTVSPTGVAAYSLQVARVERQS